MIDPATGWIEIHTVPLAWSDPVVTQVERYPLLPSKVIMNKENELLAKFRDIITNDCSIKVRQIICRSPPSKYNIR